MKGWNKMAFGLWDFIPNDPAQTDWTVRQELNYNNRKLHYACSDDLWQQLFCTDIKSGEQMRWKSLSCLSIFLAFGFSRIIFQDKDTG